MINSLLFWMILIFVFYGAYALGARKATARTAAARAEPPVIPTEKIAAMESKLAPVLAVTGRKAAGEVFQFEGRLHGPAEEAFRKIREAFAGEPVTPMRRFPRGAPPWSAALRPIEPAGANREKGRAGSFERSRHPFEPFAGRRYV